MEWYELILRALLSLFLGAAIGFERNLRVKEAGIRTHGIVAFGSCLFMLLSQFAIQNFNSDASRIASQVVSGVGFLGVGVIAYRKGAMRGLTTAAGIWTTAAIGMCCGAQNRDFIILAVVASAMMIGFHSLLHLPIKGVNRKIEKTIKIKYYDIFDYEQVKGFQKVIRSSVERVDDKVLCVVYVSIVDNEFGVKQLIELLNGNENVKSVELNDDL